jgi:hypothetical protein
MGYFKGYKEILKKQKRKKSKKQKIGDEKYENINYERSCGRINDK